MRPTPTINFTVQKRIYLDKFVNLFYYDNWLRICILSSGDGFMGASIRKSGWVRVFVAMTALSLFVFFFAHNPLLRMRVEASGGAAALVVYQDAQWRPIQPLPRFRVVPCVVQAHALFAQNHPLWRLNQENKIKSKQTTFARSPWLRAPPVAGFWLNQ